MESWRGAPGVAGKWSPEPRSSLGNVVLPAPPPLGGPRPALNPAWRWARALAAERGGVGEEERQRVSESPQAVDRGEAAEPNTVLKMEKLQLLSAFLGQTLHL